MFIIELKVIMAFFRGGISQIIPVIILLLYIFCLAGLSCAESDVAFRVRANYAAGVAPTSVVVSDFDGDGISDLAVANADSNTVVVYKGAGDGTLQVVGTYSAETSPEYVGAGDLNGDGMPDLVVTNFNSNTVSVFIGDGTGSFKSFASYPVGETPYGAAIGDFDGDGHADIAVANGGSITLLRGAGDGTLGSPVNIDLVAPFSPYSLVLGDFNSDGSPDIAVTSINSAKIAVLMNNGAGAFNPAVYYSVDSESWSVVAGDFNNDGIADLAVANVRLDSISILTGNGDGTFGTAVSFPAGSSPTSLSIGDFNSDGFADLYATNIGSNNISILKGNGDGSFQAPIDFTVGKAPSSGTVGDFNSDGKTDLVVANLDENTISILLDDRVSAVISPSPQNFGNVSVNGSSVQIFTIRNPGGSNLIVSDIAAADDDYALFSIVAGDGTLGTCGSTAPVIAAGSSCTIAVIFSPIAVGAAKTYLQITSNDPSSPVKRVPITGSGSDEKVTYVIVGNVSGANGTISCTSPVVFGEAAVCSISPTSGYRLVSLTDNGGNVLSAVSNNSYTISSVVADHAVTASFLPVITPQYAVTANVSGANGTILCTSPVAMGGTSVCSISPAEGYRLASLTDNGGSKLSLVSNNSYTISGVSADHIVAVSFSRINSLRDGIVNQVPNKIAPDISDALAVLRYTDGLADLTDVQRQHADVAPLGSDGKPLGNSIVDIADVIIILGRTLGIGSW